MEHKRQDAQALLFCFISAAAVLLICSRNAFLHPLNPWVDVNCFVTVARGWRAGLLPYRDLMEQKGPLLYFLHLVAMAPFPDSYHGLYLMEIVEVALALFLMWKIARLYTPALSVGWVAPLAAVICASYGFIYGDSAEEMCWPFVLASLFAALRALRAGRPIPLRGYVLHGFLAGCVLWIKFNQLGPHLAFMAFLAIQAVVEDRGVARALRMCGAFLLGMLLASLPWLVYFAARGALGDFLDGYLIRNLFRYPKKEGFSPASILGVLRRAVRENIPLALAGLLAVARTASFRRAVMTPREKGFLAVVAALTTAGAMCGGRYYSYYVMALAPLSAPALCLADYPERLVRRALGRAGRRKGAAARALLLAAGVVWCLLFSQNAGDIGKAYADTPQGRFGAYIRAQDDRTLLNYGTLDQGFYFAADVLPVNRYFCRLNVEAAEAFAEQNAVIRERRVNFVATKDPIEELLDWLIENGGEAYALSPDYHLVMTEGAYYLYQRNDAAESPEEESQ